MGVITYRLGMESDKLTAELRKEKLKNKRLEDENSSLDLKNKRMGKELEDLADHTVLKEEHNRLKRENQNNLADLFKARENLKDAKLENTELKHELNRLKNNHNMTDLEYQRLQNILKHKEKEIDYLKGRLKEYEKKLKNSVDISQQELSELKAQSENLILSKEDLEQMLVLKDKEIKHLRERLADNDDILKRENEGFNKHMTKLEQNNSMYLKQIQELKITIESKNSELLSKIRSITSLEEQIKELKLRIKKLESLKTSVMNLNSQLDQKNSYINDVNHELDDLKPIVKQFEEHKRETQYIKDELEKYKEFYERYKDDVNRLEDERSRLLDKLHRFETIKADLQAANGRNIVRIGNLQIKCVTLFMELERIYRSGALDEKGSTDHRIRR